MILIIEARNLVSECLARCVQAKWPSNRIIHFTNVFDCVSSLPMEGGCTFVLISFGADTAGHEKIREDIALLSERLCNVPIILISDSEDAAEILRSLDYGVRGYIPTSCSLSVALEAMNLVEVGGTFIPASSLKSSRNSIMKTADHGSVRLEGLFTARQAAVVDALRQGKANKIIAYELNMRESTVKVHVRTIMKKLKARNRTEVAYMTNLRDDRH